MTLHWTTCNLCGESHNPSQHCYTHVVKRLEADRDEALQWVRKLLPYYADNLLPKGCVTTQLAECWKFLERER